MGFRVRIVTMKRAWKGYPRATCPCQGATCHKVLQMFECSERNINLFSNIISFLFWAETVDLRRSVTAREKCDATNEIFKLSQLSRE
jgi:hypothetical protein